MNKSHHSYQSMCFLPLTAQSTVDLLFNINFFFFCFRSYNGMRGFRLQRRNICQAEQNPSETDVCKWLRTMTRGLAAHCCLSVRGLKSALNSQGPLWPVRAATAQRSRRVDEPIDLRLEPRLKITRRHGLCSSVVTVSSAFKV